MTEVLNVAGALDVDDVPVNPSESRDLECISHSRRQVLKGGLGLLAGHLVAPVFLTACASGEEKARAPFMDSPRPAIGFRSVPVAKGKAVDRVNVAEGYSARAFFSWGDPVETGAAQWHPNAENSWQEQARQAGQNHDGMHYFPFTPTARRCPKVRAAKSSARWRKSARSRPDTA
jgi:hypothetical protein